MSGIKVRGWLMIGPAIAAKDLDQNLAQGWVMGNPPDATEAQPGHFVIWQAGPYSAAVTLVCVDIPL